MRQLLESLVCNKSLITDELVQERFEASNDPELIALAETWRARDGGSLFRLAQS